MSWSIYLSGDKGIVKRELEDAVIVINQAIKALGITAGAKVFANLSGHSSEDSDGSSSYSTVFNVGTMAMAHNNPYPLG